MSSLTIGLVSAGTIFAGSLLGIGLQRLLPGHHLSKDTQDVVKLSAGTIATLTALVLGLLVSSAKSSFDTINTAIVQGSTKIIVLDRALVSYGPEASASRQQLRQSLAASIDAAWPREKTGVSTLSVIERSNGMELVRDRLRDLKPETDAQRQVVAQAQQIVGDLSHMHWFLIEQAQNQLPLSLLVILVFWLALLFVSFGLFSPSHVTAITVLFVGACAVSAAIFLVLELNQPFDGLVKVSKGPLWTALQHLGQ
jgi:hypothetical protein